MADTKITLYGEQQCRYLWAVDGDISATDRQKLISNKVPKWTMDTSFLTTFVNGLRAGNISLGETLPDRYDIYREKVGGNSYDFVGSVPDATTAIIDYACKNNDSYRYAVSIVMGNYITSPIASEQINTAWDNWCLMTVDDTDSPDRYTINTAYFFAINLDVGEMHNNTQVNKLRTFTRYLRTQKDSINCLSGNLTALVGKVDCTTGRYYNTIEMLDAARELSVSKKKKFLRDTHGNLFQVDITSDVTLSVSTYNTGDVYTKSIEWTEVGDSTGVSITKSVVT